MRELEAGCLAMVVIGPSTGKIVHCHYAPMNGEEYTVEPWGKFVGSEGEDGHTWWFCSGNKLNVPVSLNDTNRKTVDYTLFHKKMLMRLDGQPDGQPFAKEDLGLYEHV